jgi:signal transduction histidine kinase
MFFRSIKREILVITLTLTVITIAATALIGAFSTQGAGRDAAGATSETLRKQAEEFLTQVAISAAAQQDLAFERAKNDTNVVASYVGNFYDNPQIFSHGSYWNFDDRVTKKDGRYLNDPNDVSTLHVPNFVVLSQTEKNRINLTANLDFIVPQLLKNNPDAVAAYSIDTKGVTRYFPDIVLGSLAPVDYDPRPDIYYDLASPQKDPEKKVVWSPLYDDVAGRGLMITVTAPVYDKTGFDGIAATDVLLKNIINTITAYSPVEGSYAFLIDKDGQTIAFPDKAYKDILNRPRNEGEGRTNLASTTNEFSGILKKMISGKTGFGSIHSNNKEIFIAYAPLNQTGFSLGVVADSAVMLKAATVLNTEISGSVKNNIFTQVLPAGIVLILLASMLSFLLVTRITGPVQELTKGAHEIGKGNFDYQLNIKSRNEIGELATSFTQMSQALKNSLQQLQEYSRGLEEKVRERTADLSRANEQQENLLHFISHEIKGYLTKGQNAFAGIVEGDYGDASPQVKELAKGALGEMRTGVSTVMDILDASNLKKGTISFNKKPFDLKTCVIQMSEDVKWAALRKGLKIETKIDPKDPYTVVGDEEKICRHVLRNLIDNSIRYTPSGSVTTSLSREGNNVKFKVTDTGVGITPEDMPKLFTEGGHGKESIKVNVDSTGYGLFVAKQVIEAHGGKISAFSEGAGKGSTFVVDLPAA